MDDETRGLGSHGSNTVGSIIWFQRCEAQRLRSESEDWLFEHMPQPGSSKLSPH